MHTCIHVCFEYDGAETTNADVTCVYESLHIYSYVYIHIFVYVHTLMVLNIRGRNGRYGVASVSRIDKIIRLFCKRALEKRPYSAKET